jgi:hypothetical protein
MSGIKRYTDKPFKAYEYVTEADDGEYVLFSDHAIQLAALREELAKYKGGCIDLSSQVRELEHKMDYWKGEGKRADAAEERNAELVELLSEVTSYEAYLGSKLFKRISAAIKPVDPVQAVCTSCDGSGEYTDAIGDWRGYCSCPTGVALKNKPTESGASE